MRILCLGHSFGLNGAAIMLLETAAHWTQSLNWVIDATSLKRVSDAEKSRLSDKGVCYIDITEVDFNLYKLVVVNSLINIGTIDKIPSNIPAILWVHEGDSVIFNTNYSPKVWRDAFSKYRKIIFQTKWLTENVYRSFIYHLPKDRVNVIPNGMPPYHLTPKPPTSSLNNKEDFFRILNIGRVSMFKGQAELAIATLRLSSRYRLSCEFIGNLSMAESLGPIYNQLRALSNSPLIWSGELSRQEALQRLANANLFVFPSWTESQALAPIEAASLGVPVILTALPGYQELGWVHGENCLLFSIRQIDALNQCMEILITQPALRQKLIEGGYALAQKHDFETFLTTMTRLVQSV